jgi:hypothetical protein
MAYIALRGMRSNRFPLSGSGCGCGQGASVPSIPIAGFGDAASESVSANWKYATFGLVGLLGVQFWWWNKKAPEVLKLGVRKNRRRSRR